MSKEAQPLSFEEIKQGSPENYSSYRELTARALQHIQKHVGESVCVTFTKENWIYEGSEDSQQDHFTCETQVSGILMNVDERTIGIQVNSGETNDDGVVIEHKATYMKFPFYQKRFTYMSDQEESQIRIISVADQTFQLDSHKINAEITRTKELKKKERAELSVLATNARISPEQFQSLKNAIGREVLMAHQWHTSYSDEEPSRDDGALVLFELEDFNFVEDSKTGFKYLAFFRHGDKTYFPLWCSENDFGDYTSVQIHNLKLVSGEELWSFGSPEQSVTRDWRSDEIIQDIKDYSKSARKQESE